MKRRRRGNWVIMAIAGPSYVNQGIRHMRTGLYKAEALKAKRAWKKKYPDLIVAAEPWEPI